MHNISCESLYKSVLYCNNLILSILFKVVMLSLPYYHLQVNRPTSVYSCEPSINGAIVQIDLLPFLPIMNGKILQEALLSFIIY